MISKAKGRAGWHQATPKTSMSTGKSTGVASRIKATLVALVSWGCLPVCVAVWRIQHGGLHHGR